MFISSISDVVVVLTQEARKPHLNSSTYVAVTNYFKWAVSSLDVLIPPRQRWIL